MSNNFGRNETEAQGNGTHDVILGGRHGLMVFGGVPNEQPKVEREPVEITYAEGSYGNGKGFWARLFGETE